MKFRFDFVTNSSSSSFIYALNGEITDEQKIALGEFVIEHLLGEKLVSKEASLAEVKKILKHRYLDETDKLYQDILKAHAEGKDVFESCADYNCCDNEYVNLFSGAVHLLQEVSGSNFTEIMFDD